MEKKMKLVFWGTVLVFLLYVFFPGLFSGVLGESGTKDASAPSSFAAPLPAAEPSAGGDRPAAGNPPCVNNATGVANPLASEYMTVARTASGRLDSGRYGNTRNGGTKMHKGIDIKAPVGTPVYAVCDGVVESNYLNTARDGDKEAGHYYGNHVSISGKINGETVSAFYAHLQQGSLLVKPGDRVTKGQLIGYTGQTGNAYGNNVPEKHLHFEIRKNGSPVNPEPYLNGEVARDGSFTGIVCDNIPAGSSGKYGLTLN